MVCELPHKEIEMIILGILIFDLGFMAGIMYLAIMIDGGHSKIYGRKDGPLKGRRILRH